MPEKKLELSNTQDLISEYDIPDNTHNFDKNLGTSKERVS